MLYLLYHPTVTWKGVKSYSGREVKKLLYLQTDDTGARHNGKNGYCTFIGNEWFLFFECTGSKSRINFLKLLNGCQDYYFNDIAFAYMKKQGLSPKYLTAIKKIKNTYVCGTKALSELLKHQSTKNMQPRLLKKLDC